MQLASPKSRESVDNMEIHLADLLAIAKDTIAVNLRLLAPRDEWA